MYECWHCSAPRRCSSQLFPSRRNVLYSYLRILPCRRRAQQSESRPAPPSLSHCVLFLKLSWTHIHARALIAPSSPPPLLSRGSVQCFAKVICFAAHGIIPHSFTVCAGKFALAPAQFLWRACVTAVTICSTLSNRCAAKHAVWNITRCLLVASLLLTWPGCCLQICFLLYMKGQKRDKTGAFSSIRHSATISYMKSKQWFILCH